jgi:hypothetical protein
MIALPPPNGYVVQLPRRENAPQQQPTHLATSYHEFGTRWCAVSCNHQLGGGSEDAARHQA